MGETALKASEPSAKLTPVAQVGIWSDCDARHDMQVFNRPVASSPCIQPIQAPVVHAPLVSPASSPYREDQKLDVAKIIPEFMMHSLGACRTINPANCLVVLNQS